jgi:hypothetical protein|tara:strand:- start:46473 stop:47912 length:1440 start_codon:yes stop_codon:yes gene_type:complete
LYLRYYSQWERLGNEIYGESEDFGSGYATSISGDGNRIAIFDLDGGDTNLGRVRVFELQNDAWVQIGNDVPGLPFQFIIDGNVDINEDGTRFIFASPWNDENAIGSGAVRVFEFQNNTWNQIGNTLYGTNEEEFFGTSISINAEGDTIFCAGVSDVGYVNAYNFQNGIWEQIGSSITGEAIEDRAGASISTNNAGDRISLSSPRNDDNGNDAGKVRVFEFQNNTWNQIGNDILGENPGDYLGRGNRSSSNTIELNGSGNRIAVSSYDYVSGNKKGQIRVFELQNQIWTQLGSDITGNTDNLYFGSGISLNEEGSVLAVSDPYINDTGEVEVYKFENADWVQVGETISDNDGKSFGHALDINSIGDKLIIGDFENEEAGEFSPGKTTVYQNDELLAISENFVETKTSLYPNPNNGNFSIKLSETFESVSVNISEISGKQISNLEFSNTNEIDIEESLSSGIYFVSIKTTSSHSTLKMIVE